MRLISTNVYICLVYCWSIIQKIFNWWIPNNLYLTVKDRKYIEIKEIIFFLLNMLASLPRIPFIVMQPGVFISYNRYLCGAWKLWNLRAADILFLWQFSCNLASSHKPHCYQAGYLKCSFRKKSRSGHICYFPSHFF